MLDILSREHQQAEMLQTSGLSDADIAELTGSGRSSEDSDALRSLGGHILFRRYYPTITI